MTEPLTSRLTVLIYELDTLVENCGEAPNQVSEDCRDVQETAERLAETIDACITYKPEGVNLSFLISTQQYSAARELSKQMREVRQRTQGQ